MKFYKEQVPEEYRGNSNQFISCLYIYVILPSTCLPKNTVLFVKLLNSSIADLALSTKDVAVVSSFCSNYSDKGIFLTLLASPDHITSCDQLHSLKMSGLSAITFHSYHQYITKGVYSDFSKLAGWAEELKMPILIDGSYGTLDIYNIDNLDLPEPKYKTVDDINKSDLLKDTKDLLKNKK